MQFFTQKIPFHAVQYEQPERDIIFKITIFENHKKGQKFVSLTWTWTRALTRAKRVLYQVRHDDQGLRHQ